MLVISLICLAECIGSYCVIIGAECVSNVKTQGVFFFCFFFRKSCLRANLCAHFPVFWFRVPVKWIVLGELRQMPGHDCSANSLIMTF